MGHDATGSVLRFDEDGNILDGGTKIDECFFLNFSRLLTKDELDIRDIADFVNFAKEYIGIDDDVKIELAFEKTPDLKTTAYYNNGDKRLKIYVKNRAIIDICRSIAHELVHHKQNIDGRFENAIDPGADGSEFENEANAVAGVIIRKWGRIRPEIYD
jgi:hypothetical protein